MRSLRTAVHLHELGPVSRAPDRSVKAAQSTPFAHEAKQTLPEPRVGSNIQLAAVQHHGIELPDLVILEIIQVVAEHHLIGARGFAHSLQNIVGMRNGRMPAVLIHYQKLPWLLWLRGRHSWERGFDLLPYIGRQFTG